MPVATEMQQMEVDMIEGMYPDHYTFVSADPPSFAVTFSATPEDPQELRTIITYSDKSYPEEGCPTLTVENISKDRRFPVHQLKEELDSMAQQNMGMHVAALMLQRSQEWLTSVVEEHDKLQLNKRGEAISAAANAGSAPVIDPTIRMGNAITRDLFEEWRIKHMDEKHARRAEEAKRTYKDTVSKLTGRQLWDSTIRNADWELFGGAAEGDEEVVDFDAAGFEYEFGEAGEYHSDEDQ
ncbi:Hypothetical protein, putative [Bodo saltans]|uniref:RWD domain-containing protein n=1 Tax=Bodo saltans TaxID=75058 RepID=A0A0S4IZT9_BODSA|nr:Hypothetical protein, putative [Bodo saltans]|eukprot:CUG67508.1 Hypothetical protein, putative [Bodo saltans]